MSRMTSAASFTLLAKQDRQSRERQAGTTPEVDTFPTVGLIPTQPLNWAGMRPAFHMTLKLYWLARCLHYDLYWRPIEQAASRCIIAALEYSSRTRCRAAGQMHALMD